MKQEQTFISKDRFRGMEYITQVLDDGVGLYYYESHCPYKLTIIVPLPSEHPLLSHQGACAHLMNRPLLAAAGCHRDHFLDGDRLVIRGGWFRLLPAAIAGAPAIAQNAINALLRITPERLRSIERAYKTWRKNLDALEGRPAEKERKK